MSYETARVLREALAARLEVVEARLGRAPAARLDAPVAAEPEEALREMMVRLWPRVGRGGVTDAERSHFRETLASLREPAASGDLRFLDSWNNAFETAAAEFDEPMLAAYAELLRMHVDRLDLETTAADPANR
jgi:hypothetical protein